MEHRLRCNYLKCRKELNDHAVVTTCSHIFCIDCSNQLQLSGHREGRRPICPACDSQLPNPDDVVVTNLNPTEDYKTSVLSGLSPQVIMECTGRGLSFWAYQTAQDIVYQEYSIKSLTEKYGALSTHMDKIIHDANSECSNLRNRISNLEVEQDATKRRNEELSQALREKARKHMLTQELYDKLKRRAMLGQVQNAAFDAVDETIQSSVTASRYADVLGNQNMHPVPPNPFPNAHSSGMQRSASFPSSINMGPPPQPNPSRRLQESSWVAGLGGSTSSQNQPIQTPSTHRHQIPSRGSGFHSSMGIPNPQISTVNHVPIQLPRASPRQALAPLAANSAPPGFSGYGMSAGLKVSNPPGSVVNGMKQINRSRVAQRPTSGFAGHPTPLLGSSANNTNIFSNGNNYH